MDIFCASSGFGIPLNFPVLAVAAPFDNCLTLWIRIVIVRYFAKGVSATASGQ